MASRVWRGAPPYGRVRFVRISEVDGQQGLAIVLDLDEQAIMISQQRMTFAHTTTVGAPKTAASRRTIAMDATPLPERT